MTAPAPAVHTVCPTCLNPVDGLLALCWRPGCIAADIDFDYRYTRLDDN